MIGIIGNGVVGSQLAKWFGDETLVHDQDPTRSRNRIGEVLACEWVFVAINVTDNASTPHGYGQITFYLKMMAPGTKVVVKTTVVPGTCDRLQDEFPDLAVVYNPEFLTEANARQDFLHPFIQVVGDDFYGKDSLRYDWDRHTAPQLLEMLPQAPKTAVVSTRQAEWFKHAVAGWLSTKVSWFNQLCDALGDDFETVRQLMLADPRTGETHTDVNQDGYRGWGGKCFAKDTPLFAQYSRMSIMQEVVAYNDALRGVAKFAYKEQE